VPALRSLPCAAANRNAWRCPRAPQVFKLGFGDCLTALCGLGLVATVAAVLFRESPLVQLPPADAPFQLDARPEPAFSMHEWQWQRLTRNEVNLAIALAGLAS
jgi:hypothetical protein